MESFGCCSHYRECSDMGSCLFPDNENYDGCMYNKNLLAGKNFYSKKIIPAIAPKHDKIFIDCYSRNFKVGKLGSNGFSYPLEKSEVEMITETFEKLKVPFSYCCEDDKCIMEGEVQEPANSRVVFKIPGKEQEFVIQNYNSCYILKRYATGIVKALSTKGIEAKLNLVGYYANVITKVMPKVITPDEANTENNVIIGIDLGQSKDHCIQTVIQTKESTHQDDRNYSIGQKPILNINVTNQPFKQLSIFDLGLV